jgi:cellulose synthase operon protein YhjU
LNRATYKPEASGTDAATQGVGYEMPYWSGYLARLGEQVRKTANMPIWTGVPVSLPAPDGSGLKAAPHHRMRHPGGDRRMSADQRRALMQAEVHIVSDDLPVWSAYLAKLGQQLGAAKAATARGANVRSGGAPVYGIKRPIGDRRTGPRQRRGQSSSEPIANTHQDKGRWRYFAPRLLGRMALKLRRVVDPLGQFSYEKISLGMWGSYFAAKLGLYSLDAIAFHSMENLLFVALLLLPVSSRLLYRLKTLFATLLALALLYYDSWLPDIGRLITQTSQLTDFSWAYMLELSGRFFSWEAIGVLVAISLAYWIISRRIRAGVLVVCSMLMVWGWQNAALFSSDKAAVNATLDMDKVLQDFFNKETQRSVLFVTPQADAIPFDVIFIHVCSLSWDDVLAVGLDDHPLWQRFDILLKKFNSAASYSGPAAIHFMRAKCGQTEHGGMYTTVADKCYLMNSLQLSGFEPNLVLNHNGKFDDFLGQLKKHGRLSALPMSLEGLDVAQYAFDKSPVYDDFSVLDRWLQTRQTSASSRVAMYYNTVSMHDGNHVSGADASPDTLVNYKNRLSKFLDETDRFLQKLEASGRRAVVVMVPEHGAAFRGDTRQVAGLREIPTPSISLVPVGIKMVGGGVQREGDALTIDQPTSYLAISHIIERTLEQSPFANGHFRSADYVQNYPSTRFVSQNETVTVAESEGRYYLSRGATRWDAYTEFNTPEAGR